MSSCARSRSVFIEEGARPGMASRGSVASCAKPVGTSWRCLVQNETAIVRNALPGVTGLPESDVTTFAAVLAGARLVVANDSGPGHLAAAVGARLISVFGVTGPDKTRPWSTRATLVGSGDRWPDYKEVVVAIEAALGH